jgi:hypothetical protein
MATWLTESNHDKANKVILFLISPFLAFVYSLKRIKTKSSYVVFFLFSIFFGIAFTVQSGKRGDAYIDSVSYRELFEQYKFVSHQEFTKNFKDFLTFSEGKKDYYFDTVAFYVSRITDNYHVMFMVFAAVFAFFSLKTFKFLTSEDNFDASLSCYILAYLFMINQIFNINGMRFWTAAWIAVYAIFQIFKNNNKKYFLLALITPFFHGAYWIYLAVIVIAYFFKNYSKLWILLFFISFFVSNISIDLIYSLTDKLPLFLADMALSYTNPEYVELRRASLASSQFAKIFDFLIRFYLNFMVYLFIRNSKTINNNPKTQNLFSFLLVWVTFVNFTMPVPSLGGRFMTLSYPLIAYIWLVNFKGKKYTKILYAMPFVFLFSFYIQLQYYNMVLDPVFYISNPFYLIYKYLLV